MTDVRGIFSDKTINDSEVIGFLVDCLRETGGIPSVSDKLSQLGYKEFHKVAYEILDEFKQTKCLDLHSYSSQEARTVCDCIVNEINDCGDLETLMSLSLADARKLIERI